VPPDLASTDPQVVLFGLDGEVEGTTDVAFGDAWHRFDSESEAGLVRLLAQADLLGNAVVLPGPEDAAYWSEVTRNFVQSITTRLREELSDRIPESDPGFADAYALGLSMAAEGIRQQLGARVERYKNDGRPRT
jgi:hypothetical protein